MRFLTSGSPGYCCCFVKEGQSRWSLEPRVICGEARHPLGFYNVLEAKLFCGFDALYTPALAVGAWLRAAFYVTCSASATFRSTNSIPVEVKEVVSLDTCRSCNLADPLMTAMCLLWSLHLRWRPLQASHGRARRLGVGMLPLASMIRPISPHHHRRASSFLGAVRMPKASAVVQQWHVEVE